MYEIMKSVISERDKDYNRKYKVILDTDIENEIDDKFALVYLLKSLDTFALEAVTITPFRGSKYSTIKHNTYKNAKEGIDKGYDTALMLMDMLKINFNDRVYKGSTGFMYRGYNEDNDAVNKIIEICCKNSFTYILGIGGLTNIALAIKKAPSIINKFHLIWLGGNDLFYNKNNGFNFRQDIQATKDVFQSILNLTVIPGINVANQLTTTIYELEHYMKDHGEIGKYLCDEYRRCKPEIIGKSKTIWDISVIAYLINKEWFEIENFGRPSINNDYSYSFNNQQSNDMQTTFVKRLSRNKIFADFFKKFKTL